jgi:Tat protein translocase TatC
MANRTAHRREPEDRLAYMKKPDVLEHDQKVDSDERPFLDHLLELRRRILNAVLTILVLFFPLYYFANDIYSWVAAPLLASLPSGSNMIATEVASPFVTPFKLSMYSALFMSMPVILHQAWAFISPGLYLREKRFAMPLLISSIVLYYLGMLFAYYLVFPVAFKFFASVTPIGVTMMTDINKYLDFAIGLFRICIRNSDCDVFDRVDGIDDHRGSHRQKAVRDRRLFRRRRNFHTPRRDISGDARGADVDAVRSGRAVHAFRRTTAS